MPSPSPIEQAVVALLRAVLPAGTPITAETVVAALREIARHKGCREADLLAEFCRTYWRLYRGADHDAQRDNENWLLRVVATTNPRTVVDVGANRGEWLKLALACCPSAQVHAFEIVPETFQRLAEQVPPSPIVTLNNLGLSDKSERLAMNIFEGNDELATCTLYPHPLRCEIVELPAIAGDDYAAEKKIERIDMLKIDVEGAENKVLFGFSRMISEGRITVIQFEYGQANVLTKFLLHDFYDFFGRYGYVVGKLFHDYVEIRPFEFDDEDFLGPNYVAVLTSERDLVERLSAHDPKRGRQKSRNAGTAYSVAAAAN